MKNNLLILIVIIGLTAGCAKSFLDKKPDQSLVVPTTATDLQSLLDNLDVNNTAPAISQIASDEFYMDASDLQFFTKTEKGAYTWQKDLYEGGFSGEWNGLYKQVFYANLVLWQSKNLQPSPELDRIKGSAYFYRAWAYYHLGQLYAKAFDQNALDQQTSLPLRTSPEIDQQPPVATIGSLYKLINTDLDQAEVLLSTTTTYKNRPSRQSAYGLRSRVRLLMGDYYGAAASCSAYLTLNNELIDFNTLTPSAARPLPPVLENKNPEGLFYSQLLSYSFLSSPLLKIDPELYQLYESDDLRKTCFFRDRGNGIITYKGSYTGTTSFFAGIATDEILLTRAECRIRNNQIQEGLADLNLLRKNRINKNTFVPINPVAGEDLLLMVLKERKRELIARGTRWVDLRRLNKEPQFAKVISRQLGQKTYLLEPNGAGYVFPVPGSETNPTVK
ncbi:SusD family protein [Pedobacter sp. ok626]|uniref:RagB/SusD family nutrient uptake outer membrane protein n=1 Tax=Pedobacter sp. ok626 TaxID=1761882 RepID=UPI00088AC6F4|nr:RagB/SusD family nutrient uptake outer membrane protein [Pedobacter sp. ok626]SDL11291.1 SusD family protein [Pedobacter sp. ok626]